MITDSPQCEFYEQSYVWIFYRYSNQMDQLHRNSVLTDLRLKFLPISLPNSVFQWWCRHWSKKEGKWWFVIRKDKTSNTGGRDKSKETRCAVDRKTILYVNWEIEIKYLQMSNQEMKSKKKWNYCVIVSPCN